MQVYSAKIKTKCFNYSFYNPYRFSLFMTSSANFLTDVMLLVSNIFIMTSQSFSLLPAISSILLLASLPLFRDLQAIMSLAPILASSTHAASPMPACASVYKCTFKLNFILTIVFLSTVASPMPVY